MIRKGTKKWDEIMKKAREEIEAKGFEVTEIGDHHIMDNKTRIEKGEGMAVIADDNGITVGVIYFKEKEYSYDELFEEYRKHPNKFVDVHEKKVGGITVKLKKLIR